ncbi:MAG: murein biosynthesis integral membrane protein MurJ [Bauldia sp.]
MSLIKNFATVGGATASSRVLGFIRDMFIAAALGTGQVAEAFFVAQRLPNLFRRLFAEGAFTSAFVPLFAKEAESGGRDAAQRFGEEALAVLSAALLLITVAAEIGMVWLTYALAPGFAAEPGKLEFTVLLSRIAFPYLALISLTSLLSGALNGLNRFSAAAFAPALLNAVLIAALAFVYVTGERGTTFAGILLTAAISVGGVVQLVFLAVACRRAGLVLRPRLPRLTEGMKRLLALTGPAVLAGGITQINIVVGTIIASLQPGAVSWLYYADRLYQLPLGVVGIAVATVLLPDLSRSLRGGRDDVALHSQNRAIELAAALTLPAAVALFAIPAPILAVLFQRGAFTAADTAATAPALAAYAAGLPAFVAIKVLQPGFFAREDTRTPMRHGGIALVVNVIAAFALFPFFGHVGIAAATSIAAWINTLLLARTLVGRGQLRADAALAKRLPLLALAAALMGAGVFAAALAAAPLLADGALLIRLAALAGLVLFGLFLFAILAVVTGAVDVTALRARWRRQRG